MKHKLLQDTHLISALLYILIHENAPNSIKDTLTALERCFYHDARSLSRDDLDVDLLDRDTQWDLLSVDMLMWFGSEGGEHVVDSIIERFSGNEALNTQATRFINKYCSLDLDQVCDFQMNKQTDANQHQQPQTE